MKTLDLETLIIAAEDPSAAAEIFRKNFGFDVIRESGGSKTLGIGPAGIEFASAAGDERGLHAIALRVASLEDAEGAMKARGLSPVRVEAGGKPALAVGPDGTHGARLLFVEA